MNKGLSNLQKTRAYLLDIISDVTEDEFNIIPEGFNNNIIWNVAHLLVTQQAFSYLRAGQKMYIEEHYFVHYKPDSKPLHFVNSGAIEEIKRLLVNSIHQFEIDYRNNLFANYNSWTTRSGIAIHNIDDAIQFMPFHEGLHTGAILALKRTIRNQLVELNRAVAISP